MLCLTLLISCQTTKEIPVVKLRVVMPDLDFPAFPDLDDGDYERVDGGILVSEDWIIRLAEYRLSIFNTESVYKKVKDLYNESEKE